MELLDQPVELVPGEDVAELEEPLAQCGDVFLDVPALGDDRGLAEGFRESCFMEVSLVISTGFNVGDYEGWHVLAQYLLVALMM